MCKSVVLVLLVPIFVVACSSKKKVMLDTMDGTQGGVIDKPIGFDSMGSDGGEIKGLATVHFAYDRYSLTPEAKEILNENVKFIKEKKNLSFQLEGHCDSRGSTEYNLTLGEKRANTIKSYLIGLGVMKSRLSVLSYGEEKPVRTGDTEADHAANRRVNFVPIE